MSTNRPLHQSVWEQIEEVLEERASGEDRRQQNLRSYFYKLTGRCRRSGVDRRLRQQ